MKYFSLIIFAVLLSWTWHLVHRNNAVSFETHAGIQEKMAELISTTVQAKRPAATNIIIEKIWTEVMDDRKVKAFFVYSFKEAKGESGPVSSQIKGDGILERQPDDGSGQDHWTLTKVQTTGDSVQFDEATLITGSASAAGTILNDTPSESSPGTPAEPQAVKTENHQ